MEYVSLFALGEGVVCVFRAALNHYTALLMSGCFILRVNKLLHQRVARFEMHRAVVFVEDFPEFSQIPQERTAQNDNVVLFDVLFFCRDALAGSFCCVDEVSSPQDLSAFLMCLCSFSFPSP